VLGGGGGFKKLQAATSDWQAVSQNFPKNKRIRRAA